MWDRLFNKPIWKWNQAMREIERKRHDDVSEAKSKGVKGAEFQNILAYWNNEQWAADEEYRILITKQILKKARERMLSIPSRPSPNEKENEYWVQSHIFGEWYLTNEGVSLIKKTLRDESAAQFAPLYKWGGLILGSMGAASGLLAIFGIRVD